MLAFEDLTQLCYLNCVIDETMRMDPVAATASVRCAAAQGFRDVAITSEL